MEIYKTEREADKGTKRERENKNKLQFTRQI